MGVLAAVSVRSSPQHTAADNGPKVVRFTPG